MSVQIALYYTVTCISFIFPIVQLRRELLPYLAYPIIRSKQENSKYNGKITSRLTFHKSKVVFV